MKNYKKTLIFISIFLIASVKTFSMQSNNPSLIGKLFIVYGPSGAGKSTLVSELAKRLPKDLTPEQVITYTCRLPRSGEVNGRDYHFITQEEFLEKQASDFFVYTTNLYNKFYGCPRSIVNDLNSGKNLIIILDRDGTKAVAQSINNSVLIWVTAPVQELEKRLLKRNSETDEQRVARLERAKKEINEEIADKIHHHEIINDNLEQSLNELACLISSKANPK